MKKQSITIPSNMSSVPLVDNFIDTITDTFQLPAELQGCVCISIIQAVHAYILFANDGNPEKTLTLTATITGKKFIITIKDEGKGLLFQGLNSQTSTSDVKGIPRKGFYLMATLSDELLFLRKGSTVKMTFYL